jgi:hypothetical protein
MAFIASTGCIPTKDSRGPSSKTLASHRDAPADGQDCIDLRFRRTWRPRAADTAALHRRGMILAAPWSVTTQLFRS